MVPGRLGVLVIIGNTEKGAAYLSSLDETLPQIIFGGEWSTKLTFTNLRPTAVEIPVAFYGTDGKALAVPFMGRAVAATQRVNIPAGGQVILETPMSSGDSTTGGEKWTSPVLRVARSFAD